MPVIEPHEGASECLRFGANNEKGASLLVVSLALDQEFVAISCISDPGRGLSLASPGRSSLGIPVFGFARSSFLEFGGRCLTSLGCFWEGQFLGGDSVLGYQSIDLTDDACLLSGELLVGSFPQLFELLLEFGYFCGNVFACRHLFCLSVVVCEG